MSRPWVAWTRLATLLFIGIVAQTTVIPDLQFRGVRPDLMLLLGICGGMAGGMEQGAIVGFAAGLLTDLFLSDTPLGLSALTFCLVGASVGALRAAVIPETRLLAPVIGFVASAAGVVAFSAIGTMVGLSELVVGGFHHVLRIAIIEGVLNSIISMPAERLFSWASGGSRGSVQLSQARSAQLVSR